MDTLARALADLFMVTAMLGIGLQVGAEDLRSTLAARGLLARSLLANFVLVPALGISIVAIVPMPADLATGFLLLALAPGGISALQFTSRAKGALLYAGGVTLVLAVLSIFFAPAVAELILPKSYSLSVPYARALEFLLLYLALPLVVGMVAHRLSPRAADKMAKVVTVVASLTFVVFVIYLMGRRKAAIAELGPVVVGAMLVFIVGSMLIGWFLGGPGKETRGVLATVSSMRNAALCFLVASRNFPDANVDVAVIAFSALMVPPNTLLALYLAIRNRRESKRARARAELRHAHT
jgi:BASS family bile acid:Na+ symporter